MTWWGREWVSCYSKVKWGVRPCRLGEQRREENLRALPGLAKFITLGDLTPKVADFSWFERQPPRSSETTNFWGAPRSTFATIETESGVRLRADMGRTLHWPSKGDIQGAILGTADDRLGSLIRMLGQTHALDIATVWIAEREGIEVVLTSDGKFCRHFSKMKHKHNSDVRVIEPVDYLRELGGELATRDEVNSIREFHRQQRLRPMCQFRYPKSWLRRGALMARGGLVLEPLDDCFVKPEPKELAVELLRLEFPQLELGRTEKPT